MKKAAAWPLFSRVHFDLRSLLDRNEFDIRLFAQATGEIVQLRIRRLCHRLLNHLRPFGLRHRSQFPALHRIDLDQKIVALG